jgi:hypothetical protein
VHPEAAAAVFVSDAAKLGLRVLSGVALAIAATQLIPGPAPWRSVRQHLGVVNLLAVWPLVFVVAVVVYTQLPGDITSCAH